MLPGYPRRSRLWTRLPLSSATGILRVLQEVRITTNDACIVKVRKHLNNRREVRAAASKKSKPSQRPRPRRSVPSVVPKTQEPKNGGAARPRQSVQGRSRRVTPDSPSSLRRKNAYRGGKDVPKSSVTKKQKADPRPRRVSTAAPKKPVSSQGRILARIQSKGKLQQRQTVKEQNAEKPNSTGASFNTRRQAYLNHVAEKGGPIKPKGVRFPVSVANLEKDLPERKLNKGLGDRTVRPSSSRRKEQKSLVMKRKIGRSGAFKKKKNDKSESRTWKAKDYIQEKLSRLFGRIRLFTMK